jgi:hypothetical protein
MTKENKIKKTKSKTFYCNDKKYVIKYADCEYVNLIFDYWRLEYNSYSDFGIKPYKNQDELFLEYGLNHIKISKIIKKYSECRCDNSCVHCGKRITGYKRDFYFVIRIFQDKKNAINNNI